MEMGTQHPETGFDLATVDKLLTTTRAVRKRLDFSRPVPLDVVTDCLRLALQAPTGSNAQRWRWIVVTDPEVRHALADLYRPPAPEKRLEPEVPSTPQQERMLDSAQFLMRHIHEVPVMVVPCIEESGGAAGWAPSIYPAVWSFILALRSRGLGSVITTVTLYHREEAAALLGIPEGYVQSCMLPVAYYTGDDFKPAVRRPLEEVCFVNRWGGALTAD
jgi:nitroreductase